MSLLDNMKESRVDVRTVVGESAYRVRDWPDEINELVRMSSYRMHIVFCETEEREKLINLCEEAAGRILENIGSIPGISEVGKINIIWDRFDRKYSLVLGFNVDVRSVFNALWTYYSVLGMLWIEKSVMNRNVRMKWMEKRIVDSSVKSFLTYTDSLDDMNPLNDNRFMIVLLNEMRGLIEHLCVKKFSDEEWDSVVGKAGNRYMRIRPWDCK